MKVHNIFGLQVITGAHVDQSVVYVVKPMPIDFGFKPIPIPEHNPAEMQYKITARWDYSHFNLPRIMLPVDDYVPRAKKKLSRRKKRKLAMAAALKKRITQRRKPRMEEQ